MLVIVMVKQKAFRYGHFQATISNLLQFNNDCIWLAFLCCEFWFVSSHSCIVTLVAYVWMFTTVCFQMSSLSYRSVGGGACFWTGGCQDHLVCLHLLAILTGQGDISKVFGFPNWPKQQVSDHLIAFVGRVLMIVTNGASCDDFMIYLAVWEEPPTLWQGPPRHLLKSERRKTSMLAHD